MTVMDYFPEEWRDLLHPIGRLDIDTEGLLIITDDGKLDNRLMQPRHHVEKRYFFRALGFIDDEKARQLENGIALYHKDHVSAPAKFELVGHCKVWDAKDYIPPQHRAKWLKNPEGMVTSGYLTITEGKKHQVKLMIKAVDCKVFNLKRVKLGGLELDETLKPGEWRELTPAELDWLCENCPDNAINVKNNKEKYEMNRNEQLFDFIKSSPSCFHAIKNVAVELEKSGAKRLYENQKWDVKRGETSFVTRNGSSLIAVRIPEEIDGGFMVTASHSDSPTFKIKDKPELEGGNYIRLNTERYGGMILDSWFDRALSIAGRLLVRTEKGIEAKLVSTDPLVLIPHVAIHMQNPNNGLAYDPAVDMVPLYGGKDKKGHFLEDVAAAAGVSVDDIIGHDLYLVNRQEPTIWGADGEFISSPKLDDLQCAFSATRAFLEADAGKSISVLFIADNEEVGSATKQGAASTFLYDVLSRISRSLGLSDEDFHCMVARSMMLSADNAHAVHPNHPELADPTHRPMINGGVVMKYNAAQLYTTDGVSAAIFREICKSADVPLQIFCNRSDMRGGSTLGNISNSQVSMNAVDIGIAQLAMHSSYETAGALDTDFMIRAMKKFYSISLDFSDETISIK